DVHHGNGTQHIFEDRSDVLVFSIQQRMIYPGSGAMQEVGNAAGRGFTVNLPLPAGCGDAAYRHAVEQLAGPIAARFRPDLILVSAGFDAHELDPLGGMDVSDAGFGRMMEILIEVAESHCRGRIAAVLEGGYSLEGLTGGVRACLEAMTGRSFASAAAGAADDGVAGLIGRLLREHPLVSG
ncbi:MAG: histone deacetylase, partial [Planctomycetota bacterium]|nr:histone deacetylase [Planctomycetota bacterium]